MKHKLTWLQPVMTLLVILPTKANSPRSGSRDAFYLTLMDVFVVAPQTVGDSLSPAKDLHNK